MPIHSVRTYTNTDNTPRTKTPQGRYIYRNTSAEGIGPTTQAKHWAGGPGWRSGAAERIPLRTTCHHNHIGRESKQQCHPKESTPGEPSEETARRRRVRARSVDVVVHGAPPNRPATHEADSEEGHINGTSAGRGALTEAVAAPRLAGRGALTQVIKH